MILLSFGGIVILERDIMNKFRVVARACEGSPGNIRLVSPPPCDTAVEMRERDAQTDPDETHPAYDYPGEPYPKPSPEN